MFPDTYGVAADSEQWIANGEWGMVPPSPDMTLGFRGSMQGPTVALGSGERTNGRRCPPAEFSSMRGRPLWVPVL